MAKDFVGKDEKLTPGEKRLLKAAGSRMRKGGLIHDKDKMDKGQSGTRTREALARAVAKVSRMKKVAEGHVRDKAKKAPQKAAKRPAGASQDRKALADRHSQERALKARRSR